MARDLDFFPQDLVAVRTAPSAVGRSLGLAELSGPSGVAKRDGFCFVCGLFGGGGGLAVASVFVSSSLRPAVLLGRTTLGNPSYTPSPRSVPESSAIRLFPNVLHGPPPGSLVFFIASGLVSL